MLTVDIKIFDALNVFGCKTSLSTVYDNAKDV